MAFHLYTGMGQRYAGTGHFYAGNSETRRLKSTRGMAMTVDPAVSIEPSAIVVLVACRFWQACLRP